MSYSVLLIVDIDVLTTNICIIGFFCFLFLSFSEILHMKFTAHCDPQATFFSIFVALHCITFQCALWTKTLFLRCSVKFSEERSWDMGPRLCIEKEQKTNVMG